MSWTAMQHEWRRHVNNQAADLDLMGWMFNAFAYSFMLISRLWLREGQPGLALAAGSQPLAALALCALIVYRKPLYVRWRELLATMATLHLQWSIRLLALNCRTNVLVQHGGSPLLLLSLLATNNSLVWVLLISVYGRLGLHANAMLLAATALHSLLTSDQMCARALEAPGIATPFEQLYNLLSLAHAPVYLVTGSSTAQILGSQAATVEQQCHVISQWMALAGGVLAPLAIVWRLERRARRTCCVVLRRQGRGQEPLARQLAAWQAEHKSRSWVRWLESGSRLYLLTALIWMAAHAL